MDLLLMVIWLIKIQAHSLVGFYISEIKILKSKLKILNRKSSHSFNCV